MSIQLVVLKSGEELIADVKEIRKEISKDVVVSISTGSSLMLEYLLVLFIDKNENSGMFSTSSRDVSSC